ncbi:hypothetical protein MVEN_02194300 [Mycena venus]|uniref:F-box domain-containing protein n=1 Tax=Mycena venus TaxID=2733690 RepID=A0A8H6X6F9_9AGAR|nr:hypothetical protein MVEN_02194300 [Mycena venus]
MHHALTISEIVHHIFKEILDRYDSPNGPALAALARICFALHDTALDLLWDVQPSLKNFLNCFPSGLMFEAEMEASHLSSEEWYIKSNFASRPVKDLFISRAGTEEDWEQPLFYSNRIKRLVVSDDEFWILSSAAFQKLCMTIPGGAHIFPNLASLRMQIKIIGSVQHCLALLTTTLPFLEECSSSLTVVSLSFPDTSLLDSVSRVVQNMRRIEDLAVDNLNEAALTHLAGLRSLKTLRLNNSVIENHLPATNTSLPDIDQTTRSPHFSPSILAAPLPNV